jgi:hypothetical protein
VKVKSLKLLTMKLTFVNISCVMLVVAALSASCTKLTDANTKDSGTEPLSGIGPVAPYTWTKLDIPGRQDAYPFNKPWADDVVAPVGDTYYLWTGTYKEKIFRFNKSSLRWEPRPAFITDPDLLLQHKVLFKYQSKLYYSFNDSFDPKFGAYDPLAGTKTSLAPFPAPDSINYFPHTFVVGDNGYIFFDYNHGYWKYNFPSNTWTALGENPFYGRKAETIVVANGKVYGGMGYTVSNIGGIHYHRDWFTFDPEAPGSVSKADFPFYVTGDTKTCVIGDNIYVGFGKKVNTTGSDFMYNLFRYNINSNQWYECTDWPGTPLVWSASVNAWIDTRVNMFSIGSSVYVVSGGIYECWRYGNTPIITGVN